MKFRALAITFAASAMVLAPVAAEAGTKAASVSAPVTYGARSTAKVDSKKKADGAAYILGSLALAAGTVGILIATDVIGDDDDGRSPGAL